MSPAQLLVEAMINLVQRLIRRVKDGDGVTQRILEETQKILRELERISSDVGHNLDKHSSRISRNEDDIRELRGMLKDVLLRRDLESERRQMETRADGGIEGREKNSPDSDAKRPAKSAIKRIEKQLADLAGRLSEIEDRLDALE